MQLFTFIPPIAEFPLVSDNGIGTACKMRLLHLSDIPGQWMDKQVSS